MRVAIAGGKLQGIEAAYLAKKAGWEAILIDKKKNPPAAGLCAFFYNIDILKDCNNLCSLIQDVDLIIPAIENSAVLNALKELSGRTKIPLAYDADSYFITKSKKLSNRLFKKLGIQQPEGWPECGYPVIAKPSVSSGSRGVLKLDSKYEMDAFIKKKGDQINDWILQEYLEGPSYSIEVLGLKGSYIPLQITELAMDSGYDCNKVFAPAGISKSLDGQIKQAAVRIAENLDLKGIMDVEFILDKEALKILEIDARLPSQTPAAVYKSTGINMLKLISGIFVQGVLPEINLKKEPAGVIYEHIRVWKDKLEFPGEHIMGEAGKLEIIKGFFGADEAITDFNAAIFPWVATLISTGKNTQEAYFRHKKTIENIKEYMNS